MERFVTAPPAMASSSPPQPCRTITYAPGDLADDTNAFRVNVAHQCVSAPTLQAVPAMSVAKVAAGHTIRDPVSSQAKALRIAIRSGGRIIFLNPGDLFAVVAQGNYVLLQSEGGRYRVRESISVIAEKLKPCGFVRVQRSLLVNKSWVEEIRPSRDGKHLFRLRNGRELIVSRSWRKSLASLAEMWL